MLEASRISPVPPEEVTACEFCGAGSLPGHRTFVAFDNGRDASDVMPGLVHTVDDRAGSVAYRRRDIHSGQVTTLEVRKQMMCSDCIKVAAELVGYADTQPLEAANDDLNRQLLELRQELERSEQERIDADAALRATKVFQRLLPDPERGKTDDAKRPPTKSRAVKGA